MLGGRPTVLWMESKSNGYIRNEGCGDNGPTDWYMSYNDTVGNNGISHKR